MVYFSNLIEPFISQMQGLLAPAYFSTEPYFLFDYCDTPPHQQRTTAFDMVDLCEPWRRQLLPPLMWHVLNAVLLFDL